MDARALLVGVDVGTGSARAGVFTTEVRVMAMSMQRSLLWGSYALKTRVGDRRNRCPTDKSLVAFSQGRLLGSASHSLTLFRPPG
jgi:hypothetical protein